MEESIQKCSSPTAMTNENTAFPLLQEATSETRSIENESTKQPLYGLLDGDGPSMFDESHTADATDPQSLSVASAPVLQNIIDHHGAADLIRRLSAALAERDAHVTALTRLAQEYKIPHERIADTASRAKQAERRRLSLATASEDLAPPSAIGSDSSESQAPERPQDAQGALKGITKLFGGVGKRQESLKPTPASSRSTSRPPKASERPRSTDVQSIKSVQTAQSAEGMGWTSAIFGSSSIPKRRDSLNNRVPVEMTTRHDKDQLPPTLSNHPEDPQDFEWNAFLIRLVELRQQNGEDIGDGGELIGASQFGRQGNEGRKKMEQLTRLVVGGIPMNLRHAIWMELSNTQAIMKPDAYAYYLALRDSDDQAEINAILKDVPRTLTTKYDFYSGRGFKKLQEVLVAFVGRYPDLGYTQGLNTIAGYLLLAIPSQEDAFWVLCNIVENFFPHDYFSRRDAMTSSLADNILLREYVKELMPALNEHMARLHIRPEHTVPIKWFFTAFSSALPEMTLMRLWDVWLCLPNQKNFLFAFALALLSQNTEGIMACEDDGAYFAFLDDKLTLPEDPDEISELVKLAYRIGKKVDNVAERRSEMKESTRLEKKLRLRKTLSLEVLVDLDEGTAAEAAAVADQ